MIFNTEERSILQSAYTASLLMALSLVNDKFVKSDIFTTMTSAFPIFKSFKNTGIVVGNQGTMLMCLYALLVLPKELISKKYQSEYDKIDKFIPSIADAGTKDTYETKGKYLHHIRNAVSHGKTNFDDMDPKNIKVIFQDENVRKTPKPEFSIAFPVSVMPTLLLKLLEVHDKYIQDINTYNV
jgi:hypothetical protein